MRSFLSLVILMLWAPLSPAQAPTPVCDVCYEEITEEGIEFERAFYHKDCFVCAACDDPLKTGFTTYRGENYHPQCYNSQFGIRCAICDQWVDGEHVIDPWGNAYHKRHTEETEACPYCERYISERASRGSFTYPDGRLICGICHWTAILDPLELAETRDSVCVRLAEIGFDFDCESVPLQLSDLPTMESLQDYAPGMLGHTFYEEAGERADPNHRVQIHVLTGMPKLQALTTLTHELTHAWQFLEGQVRNDDALNEGSCNYAAYLVLTQIDSPESNYLQEAMMASDDPEYGEGLRRVKRYADENSVGAWIEWLRQETGFPEGY